MSRNVRQKPHYIDPELDDLEEAPLRPATPGAVSTAHLSYANVVPAAPRGPRLSLADAWAAGDAHRAAIQRKASSGANAWEDYIFGAHLGAMPPADATEPQPATVQRKANDRSPTDTDIQAIAASGIEGNGQPLPHLDRIQAAFGPHDVSRVRAHIGGPAASAADAIGAEAYATGTDVAFQSTPDLHTAAHEAAHVIQQQQGVHLKGGVGQAGDTYEQHADAVADKVVRGESAETLLTNVTTTSSGGPSIQLRPHRHRRAKAMARHTDVTRMLEHADLATHSFDDGIGFAVQLYKIVDGVIHADSLHDQLRSSYDKASDAYDDAKKPGGAEVFFSFLGSMADLGLGAYGLYRGISGLARTIRDTKSAIDGAKALRQQGFAGDAAAELAAGARKSGAQLETAYKGGSGAIKAAKGVTGVVTGPSPDLAKQLTDLVARNADQANAAFLGFAKGQAGFDMLIVRRTGSFAIDQMDFIRRELAAIARDGLSISEGDLDRIIAAADRARETGVRFAEGMRACQQLWSAYQAGGRDALADPRQRTMFDVVSEWIRSGDPRAQGIQVAADERRIQYIFDTRPYEDAHHVGGTGSRLIETCKCHAFATQVQQEGSARLFFSDVKVERALSIYVDKKRELKGGPAQWAMQKVPVANGANQWACTPSLAKALASIGVRSIAADAEITLTANGEERKISGQNSNSPWFEEWWETPAFASFWQTSLGGRFGFLYDRKKAHRITFSAGIGKQEASTHVHEPPSFS